MEVDPPDGGTPAEDGVLEPVGRGTQGDVFGNDRWVVKVPRLSVFSVLAKWVSSWKWTGEVEASLGGLAAPFLALEDVNFRAPKMTGRSGKIVEYNEKVAIVRERYFEGDFLDHKLSLAEPAEALELVERMVVLVERVRARGFYMHDFIMKNFAVVDGELMVVDTGLISPLRRFWEPAMRFCAWGFSKGLSKDYQRLLGEVLDEVEDDDALRERIQAFSDALPERIGRLRQRKIADLVEEPPVPVGFDPKLEKEVRVALGLVR